MAYEERERKSLNRRTEKFIQKSKEKYGNGTYDYSLAKKEYKNNRTPVHLICNRCENSPFLVYPFAHTFHGINDKGTCPHCYVPKNTVQETRWNPNLPKRIKSFKNKMDVRHKGKYSYPLLDEEYKNDSSSITVICNQCKSKPYTRLARALMDLNRYAGCAVCNKEKMAETIKVKNKVRQRRNYQTKDMPHKYGCIYKIINTINDKFYIGYTTMTAKRRLKSHIDETRRMQKKYKGKKSYLHNAMNHHSVQNFKVEVLEEFTNVTPIYLGTLEMEYIANEKPHYNVSPGGELGNYTGVKNVA